jgi:peptidoglycan biosynthesis protein MviN/MurJ (putative lipid II flippase)
MTGRCIGIPTEIQLFLDGFVFLIFSHGFSLSLSLSLSRWVLLSFLYRLPCQREWHQDQHHSRIFFVVVVVVFKYNKIQQSFVSFDIIHGHHHDHFKIKNPSLADLD